jgi:hypothetical protein
MSAAAPSLTPEALPAVTVPPLRNGVGSLASASSVVSPRMLVALDQDRGPLRCATATATISRRGSPISCAASARRLAAERERVLVSRAHLELAATFSAVSGIEIDAVLRLHHWIHEAPADRGVVDLASRGNAASPWHHEGRAAHALDAAGDHQLGLAGADRARGTADRVEPEPHRRLTVAPGR